MSARLTHRLKAKEMVNQIYQPLGKLMCHVSNDEMWEYAKDRTREQLHLVILETQGYPQTYWREVLKELDQLP